MNSRFHWRRCQIFSRTEKSIRNNFTPEITCWRNETERVSMERLMLSCSNGSRIKICSTRVCPCPLLVTPPRPPPPPPLSLSLSLWALHDLSSHVPAKKRTTIWCNVYYHTCFYCRFDRLVGLVVRRPPRERKTPGSNPTCAGNFSGLSHTIDLKIGTPVSTLPGAWRYKVSTGTGRPGVSILWLGEVERLICNFYLSVTARQIVWADPSLRYIRLLLGR